jgi:hypothetical protein
VFMTFQACLGLRIDGWRGEAQVDRPRLPVGIDHLAVRRLAVGAAKSNEALAKLAPRVQWVESYVADDKTFCVYLAEDEAAVREHAEISGFPANRITEVRRIIDPTTAAAA